MEPGKPETTSELKVAYISCANSKRDISNKQGFLQRQGAFLGALDTLSRRGVQVLGLTEWGKYMDEKAKNGLLKLMAHFGWAMAGTATPTGTGPVFSISVFVRGLALQWCTVASTVLRTGEGDECTAAAFTYTECVVGYKCSRRVYKILFTHLSLDFEGNKWDAEVKSLIGLCARDKWSAIGDFNRIIEDFDRRTELLKPANVAYGALPTDITFAPWKTDPVPMDCFKKHPELVSANGQQFSSLDCAIGQYIRDVRVCLPLPSLPYVEGLPPKEKIASFEARFKDVEAYQTVSDHFVLIASLIDII